MIIKRVRLTESARRTGAHRREGKKVRGVKNFQDSLKHLAGNRAVQITKKRWRDIEPKTRESALRAGMCYGLRKGKWKNDQRRNTNKGNWGNTPVPEEDAPFLVMIGDRRKRPSGERGGETKTINSYREKKKKKKRKISWDPYLGEKTEVSSERKEQ